VDAADDGSVGAKYLMYNKIFTKILDSSIWLESEATRIVWVTMLAAMDEDGFVQMASLPNLARRANVSVEAAASAVHVLESPDPNSSNPLNEGRRIERVDGGWLVLNAGEYRSIVSRAAALEANRNRVRAHRARKRSGNAVKLGSNGSVMESQAGSSISGNVQEVPPPQKITSTSGSPAVVDVSDKTKNEIWQRIVATMPQSEPRKDQYLRPCHLLKAEPKHLVVNCPNTVIAQWNHKNYRNQIKDAVATAFPGWNDVCVHFVVKPLAGVR
jgi:hypothetical protein